MHCSAYKESSPAERKSLVEKHQLCRNCLGNHTTAACPSKKGCFTCGERHHTTIHEAIKDVSTPERTTHHAQDCCNKSGDVLLATRTAATVDIFGVGGQQLAKARGRVTLDISASRKDDPIKVTAVILSKLSTYTHCRTRLNREWVHLQGLQLADPSPGNGVPIDVLIGADVYPSSVGSLLGWQEHRPALCTLKCIRRP